MNQKNIFKKVLCAGFVIACIGGVLGYSCYANRTPIYEFDYQRDMKDVQAIFDRDLYWLSADETYNPDFTFRYRTPHENPLYFGQLRVKVLRLDNKLIGFTAYYLESKTVGRLLFIAVNPEYRGKRYGQQLAEYALQDMKKMGALQIKLVTRPSNISGQKLYNRVGFVEQARDEMFVYFLYTVK